MFYNDWWKEAKVLWGKRHDEYLDPSTYQEWFASHADRIKELFDNEQLKTIVFGRLVKAFKSSSATTDSEVQSTISQVALANAVIAGLPGKLGVGVYVSMAMEAWMAYRIGTKVGVKMDSPKDVFMYFGLFAGILATIGWGFVHILRFVFSLIVNIPGVPATFTAELLVTNFIGTLFWVGFEETKDKGSFVIPRRMFRRIRAKTFELFRFQYKIIKNTVSYDTLKVAGDKAWAWLNGDFILPSESRVRGEMFFAGAVACLLQRDYSQLDGPLGKIFLQSIRDRWSQELSNASAEKISEYFGRYDADQMVGVVNVIKGKMFEHLVAAHENSDDDEWLARLHEDESYPGSDIIFTNVETGQELEVSLKAAGNEPIIEAALLKYPEIPIMTTSEVGNMYSEDPRVKASDIGHEELQQDTEDLVASLMNSSGNTLTMLGVASGTAAASVIQLWPLTMAHLREKISREQLEAAFIDLLGEQGKHLAIRVTLAGVLGPIYAWYLLARGVMNLTPEAKDQTSAQSRRLEYKPRISFTL